MKKENLIDLKASNPYCPNFYNFIHFLRLINQLLLSYSLITLISQLKANNN